jgi:hypothetical protein
VIGATAAAFGLLGVAIGVAIGYLLADHARLRRKLEDLTTHDRRTER